MSRSTFINLSVVLLAIALGAYHLYVKPILAVVGYGRIIESIGNTKCTSTSEVQACEKIVLHQPTGVLYLACSTPESRTHWLPASFKFDEQGASRDDYVATYDARSGKVVRLKLSNFNSSRGLSVHGMDVVPSASDPNTLFVYLVNHRSPLGDRLARDVGADSAIEVFKAHVDGDVLTHIRTVEDPVIITPNDIAGSSDGQSFFFTNDHGEKIGWRHELELLGRASSSIGYCHVEHGCKFAATNMHGNNGIARAPNDTFYVANVMWGGITIMELQADNTLVRTDFVATDRGIDNIAIDANGAVWAAGYPDILKTAFKHSREPSIPAPSSAHRITINTGTDAFYGHKFRVDKASI
ncbi:hypothetical protein AX16_006957 [Volvariella volvacea WC 439]|nr:hypothetical protein AX16_006957 [Volvariella volvacea WC 439]